MKKIVFFILISVSFISCIETLDIELDQDDKKMVLNGIISPDSIITVNLSKSIYSLDGDAFIKFVEDAEVKLYEDGVFIETMQYDTFGNYLSSIKPQLGKKYSVTAQNSQYEMLSATTEIPQTADIKEFYVDIQIDSATETWYDPNTGNSFDTTFYYMSGEGTGTVVFDDLDNENNYYLLCFSIVKPIYVYDNYGNMYIKGYYRQPVWYNMQNQNDNLTYFSFSSLFSGVVFNDVFFDGTEKTLIVNIDTWALFDDYAQDLPQSPLYVHLYSLSEDAYEFISTYTKYQEAISNPFAEPVNIYTNVQNGLGLFAGVYAETDSLEIVNPGVKKK